MTPILIASVLAFVSPFSVAPPDAGGGASKKEERKQAKAAKKQQKEDERAEKGKGGRRMRERTQGNAGIGITLGDPSGLSIKYFARPAHAIQAELAYGPIHYHAGRLGMDYLWHPATFVSDEKLDLVPYLGLGVGFAVWPFQGAGGIRDDRVHLGPFVRLPVLGLAIQLRKKPIDFVFEGAWSPMWDVRTEFLLAVGDVSFKIRWYL